jgi:hypothetical protein
MTTVQFKREGRETIVKVYVVGPMQDVKVLLKALEEEGHTVLGHVGLLRHQGAVEQEKMEQADLIVIASVVPDVWRRISSTGELRRKTLVLDLFHMPSSVQRQAALADGFLDVVRPPLVPGDAVDLVRKVEEKLAAHEGEVGEEQE